ncbi:hypothetical protein [Pleionea litopenaei]|uniref:Uncharacterized protein n=1 Tax=Pleionea litopenaei TaxID=3070815 RepID=A0AA51RX64_9GAMM|nr:hypothetical protein [Pleionea sp. HL-JVS1]WMS89283.1 hypothetical protein Q9312_19300 [Pleionea sp. HL-JVS1]
MFDMRDLKQGLEWIEGRTKITIEVCGNNIDIHLYPDYPSEKNRVSLDLCIVYGNRVWVRDLLGNGFSSGIQNKGYGTLLFNIGIQVIYTYFGIAQGNPEANNILVSGKTSSVGDPGNEPAKSECRDRRNGFWSNFGFKLKEPDGFFTPMKAKLSELHARLDGKTENGTLYGLDLEQFWLKGNAPLLFESDIRSLMKLDIESLDLDICPTQDDIEGEWVKAVYWSKIIRKTLFCGLSVVAVYFAFSWLDLLHAFSMSFTAIFICYFLSMYLDERSWRYLPAYKKYNLLQNKRGEIISNARQYIKELEKQHNGFFWRLYQGLRVIDQSLSANIFNEMSEHSKSLYTYFLADRYDDYAKFIRAAKVVVVNKGLA